MKWMRRVAGGLGIIMALLTITFLLLRTPDTDPGAMREKYGGPPSQFVTLPDGQNIHLRDEGPRDAPAIILLHGSNADLHSWQPWVDALATDFRIIRYDQIGHGLSGPSQDGRYALEDFVSDIGQVADHLGLERFVLGGNSMGGWVSVGYALAHPGRLNGLVLVDASGAPVRRTPGQGGNIGFTIAAMPGVNRIIEQVTPRGLVERSLRQSVSKQNVASPAAVDRYWELLRYPGNRAATIARFNTPRTVYTAQEIGELSMPTLIIWGDEDTIIPLAAGRWYDRHLPNSDLVVLEGVGHLPMEEAAVDSAAALRSWMAGIRPET